MGMKQKKPANSQFFFAKILEIGPWVSSRNLCEGHQCGSNYMVVRLSDVRYKTGKNSIFSVFASFRPDVRQPDDLIGGATLMLFTSISPTDPRTNL